MHIIPLLLACTIASFAMLAVALTILSINESINLYFIHSNCIDKASRLLVKVERIGYEGKHRYGLILLFYRAISPKLFLYYSDHYNFILQQYYYLVC